MLRTALRSVARRGLHTTAALRAEEAVASKHTTAQFLEQWKVSAPPHLDPPLFPSNIPSFAAASHEIPATIPEKLTFTFYMPHEAPLKGEEVPQPIRPGVFCGLWVRRRALRVSGCRSACAAA